MSPGRHNTFLAGLICISAAFLFSTGHLVAADKNANLPTRSGDIKGKSDSDGTCSSPTQTLTYELTAGPGDVTVQVSGRPAGGWFEHRFGPDNWCYKVSFNETAANHPHGFPPIDIKPPAPGSKQEPPKDITLTKTLKLPEKTRLIMTVQLAGHFSYRIKLSGAVVVPSRPVPSDPQQR